MRRVFDEPELLDQEQPVSPELERGLQSLRVLNQYFGAYRLMRHFARCWLRPGRTYRVLDLATGFGDIPRMLVRWARRHGISLTIDAVELMPSTLEIARRASVDYPEIYFIRADARTYSDAMTYDLVCCSLALHHFSETDALKVLRRACELSHDKVLVTDLERSWLTWACVRAVTALAVRDPMTRHDGRVSVKRAFSYRELDELAQAAGWRNFGHGRFLPARQAIWMSSREVAPVAGLSAPSFDFAT